MEMMCRRFAKNAELFRRKLCAEKCESIGFGRVQPVANNTFAEINIEFVQILRCISRQVELQGSY